MRTVLPALKKFGASGELGFMVGWARVVSPVPEQSCVTCRWAGFERLGWIRLSGHDQNLLFPS